VAVSVEHLPARPSWGCLTCYQEWPCDPARERLAADHRHDRLTLLILMWLYLDDFANERSSAQLAEAHERFVGWAAKTTPSPQPKGTTDGEDDRSQQRELEDLQP
jgi:hypothetical protein